MAAVRLHQQLGSRERLEREGGSIDVFGAIVQRDVPLLLRPLQGLLGAYLRDPMPGLLVTTQRPLSIQRFTAAHELGHHIMLALSGRDGGGRCIMVSAERRERAVKSGKRTAEIGN